MAGDVIALMDYLGVEQADLAGYSMGGFISASLLIDHPRRWRSAVLAGVGDALLRGSPRLNAEAMADAFEAKDGASVGDERARGFRVFAERSGNDLGALAAMQRSPARHAFDPAALTHLAIPVMVLTGEKDVLVGTGEKLAAAIPGAKRVVVPGDHITAVGEPKFRQAILEFLTEQSPVAA
jgi:pimeloyl-ACP methyl ester carboxylesterase